MADAQSLAILGLMGCTAEAAQRSLSPSSPLLAPFAVGESDYALLAGNITIVAGFGALHSIIAELVVTYRRRKQDDQDAKNARLRRRAARKKLRKEAQRQGSAGRPGRTSSDDTASGESEPEDSERPQTLTVEEEEKLEQAALALSRQALGDARYPALSFRVFLFFLPGSAYFAFQQIVDPGRRTPDGTAFGVAWIALSIGVMIVGRYKATTRSTFDGLYLRYKKAFKQYDLSRRWRQVLIPRGTWLPSTFSHRYGPLFTAAKRRRSLWFFVVFLPVRSMLFGFLAAWKPQDVFGPGTCWIQFSLVALLCAVQIGVVLWARPFRWPVANVGCILNQLALIFLCISQLTPPLTEAVGRPAVVTAAVTTCSTTVGLALLAFVERRLWQKREERARKRVKPIFGEPKWSRTNAASEEPDEFGHSSEEEEFLEAIARKEAEARKKLAVADSERKLKRKLAQQATAVAQRKRRDDAVSSVGRNPILTVPTNPLLMSLVSGSDPVYVSRRQRGLLEVDDVGRDRPAAVRIRQLSDDSDEPSSSVATKARSGDPGPLQHAFLWNQLPESKSAPPPPLVELGTGPPKPRGRSRRQEETDESSDPNL
jgi:hypothetical protein